jgi:transposase-like protein
MAADLDAQVDQFHIRLPNQGLYTFLAADALNLKDREGGRVVNVHAFAALGVNADGTARSSDFRCLAGVRSG